MPPFSFNSESKTRRRRGVVLTPKGLKRLQDAIQFFEVKYNGYNRFTLDELSDRINVSTKTLSRLWSLNSGVDQKTLRLCFSTFNLQLQSDDYTISTSLEEPDAEISSPPDPATIQAPQNHLSLSYPGGAIASNSSYYINRDSIEELAYREVTQPGCVIRIRAPRGMGKSSLAVRLLSHAERLGYATLLLDCTQIDGEDLGDLNKLLRCFCQRIAIELGVSPRLDDYWIEDIGSKLSCTLYFKNYLLQQVDSAFVLVLDEIDCLFEYPKIAQEFFPMLRSWYEAARRYPEWQKLRQVVVYSTEDTPAIDINYSPFNVGLPLRLTEFTPQQVQELADRYGLNWSLEQVEPLIALVGGHPTLIQIAFYYLCCEGMSLETLLRQAEIDGGVFRYYLRQRWGMLQKQPQLVDAIATLLQSEQSISLDPTLTYQLESQGLIRYESGADHFLLRKNRIELRCQLYRIYFKHLIGRSLR